MARVTFIDGIASISGKLGDVVFRRSISGKTYACKAPTCKARKPSKKEMQHRQRFAMTCKLVSAILADSTQRDAYALLQKNTPGAKKLTLRKFVFKKVLETLL